MQLINANMIWKLEPHLTYINNHTSTPHVQASIVAFVTQDLGCKIGRGTNNRFTERLFSNDAGESKITQLNLQKVWIWLSICDIELDLEKGVRILKQTVWEEHGLAIAHTGQPSDLFVQMWL